MQYVWSNYSNAPFTSVSWSLPEGSGERRKMTSLIAERPMNPCKQGKLLQNLQSLCSKVTTSTASLCLQKSLYHKCSHKLEELAFWVETKGREWVIQRSLWCKTRTAAPEQGAESDMDPIRGWPWIGLLRICRCLWVDLYFPGSLIGYLSQPWWVSKDKVGFFVRLAQDIYWTNSNSLSQNPWGSPDGISGLSALKAVHSMLCKPGDNHHLPW